jgi:hypothetical protein
MTMQSLLAYRTIGEVIRATSGKLITADSG